MGYIKELRKLIGNRPIIMTGVCVIVLNDNNEILLQKRTDSFDWGTIGGALELGETLEEAAHRELYEEAGLKTNKLEFKTILSGKDMNYIYPNGDEVYLVSAVYEVRNYEGIPTINDDEGSELKFFSFDKKIENLNETSYKILTRAGYLKV